MLSSDGLVGSYSESTGSLGYSRLLSPGLWGLPETWILGTVFRLIDSPPALEKAYERLGGLLRLLLKYPVARVLHDHKEPKRDFKVGDKIRVNLHHGKIEDAIVRAVIQHTDGIKLQVDGLDLTVLIDTRQVSSEVALFCSREFKIELPSGNLSAGWGILVERCLVPRYLWQVLRSGSLALIPTVIMVLPNGTYARKVLGWPRSQEPGFGVPSYRTGSNPRAGRGCGLGLFCLLPLAHFGHSGHFLSSHSRMNAV